MNEIAPPTVPDIVWLAWTVWLEAEGEGPSGWAAVAWTIRNRMAARQATARQICLTPAQYSGWAPPRLAALIACSGALWSALWAVVRPVWAAPADEDPTRGATHYLNVEEVLRLTGRLPAWAADPSDPQRVREAWVTARIGQHTFLRGPVVPRPPPLPP